MTRGDRGSRKMRDLSSSVTFISQNISFKSIKWCALKTFVLCLSVIIQNSLIVDVVISVSSVYIIYVMLAMNQNQQQIYYREGFHTITEFVLVNKVHALKTVNKQWRLYIHYKMYNINRERHKNGRRDEAER